MSKSTLIQEYTLCQYFDRYSKYFEEPKVKKPKTAIWEAPRTPIFEAPDKEITVSKQTTSKFGSFCLAIH